MLEIGFPDRSGVFGESAPHLSLLACVCGYGIGEGRESHFRMSRIRRNYGIFRPIQILFRNEYLMNVVDRTALRMLALLQEEAGLSVNELARRLDIPPSSCHRRFRALEDAGLIRARVALVDGEAVGLSTVAFVAIRTNRHEPAWLEAFARAAAAMPEILEIHRLSGNADYLLKVVVPDIAGFDAFYKRLIAAVPLYDVSTSFSMERIKETTALPLNLLRA
ncbi:MAG: Lrp/AsnC family transcriptional regulator [Alphaproteobacteria bacterium]